MKTKKLAFDARLALFCVALTALLASARTAGAQANLTFSGGNGAPFVLTLNSPVTYSITATSNQMAPFFDFQGVGNFFGSNNAQLSNTGTITFSINGGPPKFFSGIASGSAFGVVTANDIYMYGTFSGATVGDIVTLSAGTLMTAGSFASAPPQSGSFPTFIFQGDGTRISTNGVAVPEPATWATLLGGLGLLGPRLFRRQA